MPPQPGTKVSEIKRGKKKSFWGRYAGGSRKFFAHRGRELEEIATGLPAGAVAVGDALQKAARPTFLGGDADPLIKIGEDVARQTKADLEHPLRNPTATALTLLGVASLFGGTAARGAAGLSTARKTGSASRGVRQALGPQLYERSFTGIAKVPGQKARKYKNVPASRSAPIRGLRKVTLDPAYNISRKRAERANVKPRLKKGSQVIDETSKDYLDHVIWDKTKNKRMTDPDEIKKAVLDAGYVGIRKKSGNIKLLDPKAKKVVQPGQYARTTENRERQLRARLHRQVRGGDPEEFGNPAEVRKRAESLLAGKFGPGAQNVGRSTRGIESGTDIAKYLLGAPMNLVRASMYVRPRYAVQNLTGTAQLLAHQGNNLPRNIRLQQQIRKLDPEAYEIIKNMHGSAGATSISIGAEGPGVGLVHKLGNIAQKPEEWTRPLGVINEMNRTLRQGGRKVTAADLAKFAKSTSKEGVSALLGAQRRSLDELVDYNRLGRAERGLMRSQIPIFYPMTKGFTRYAASFPTRHPVQAGAAAQLGNFGKEQQEAGFGGLEPPPWAPYAYRTGDDTIKNPQNLYTFSPGSDVGRQFAQAFAPGKMIPGLNVGQQTGPLPQLLSQALLGRDLATGYSHLGEDEGHSAVADAFKDFAANSIPFADVVRSSGYNPGGIFTEPRTFKPMTIQEQLMYNLLGPAFVDRRTDMQRFLKGSKDARKIRRSRKY